jgi:hypothetical protein
MNQNEEIMRLMTEILNTTMEIKDSSPEVYKYLDETPLYHSRGKSALHSANFEDYLHTIQAQLKMANSF